MNPIHRTFPRGKHVTDSGAIVCIGTFPTFRDVPSAVTIGVKADKEWTAHSIATDPNVRSPRAVQKGFGDLVGCGVLHQCIWPLLRARFAAGHHGYQRACDLISGQTSNGPFESPVFGMRRAAGKLRLDEATSLIAPHFAPFLRSCLGAVPSSRPAPAGGPRALRMKARLLSFGFSLLLQPQNMCA
jgi:hypothetical protein